MSNEYKIKADIQKENPAITLNDVIVVSGDVSLSLNNTFDITFLPVKGGFSSFFGYRFNEKDGNNYGGRLRVECSDIEHEFSVNQILKWQTKNVENELVYIAPKICE